MIVRPRLYIVWAAGLAAAALAIAGCGESQGQSGGAAPRSDATAAPSSHAPRTIGLFTTLPILWNDAADIGALLSSASPPHWARQVLEQGGTLRPIDALAHHQRGAAAPLDGIDVLVMAQPRPLSPQENVALDDWVRAGGKVLLFADPMLTEDSVFALGDKRRPQDVVMLSPILARWGLRLTFDDEQPAEMRAVGLVEGELPTRLAGGFAAESPDAPCSFAGEAILADCRVGSGRVVALADAALLERESVDSSGFASLGARRATLEHLLARASGAGRP